MTENVPSAAFSILASLLAHASMHVGFSLTLRVDCFFAVQHADSGLQHRAALQVVYSDRGIAYSQG